MTLPGRNARPLEPDKAGGGGAAFSPLVRGDDVVLHLGLRVDEKLRIAWQHARLRQIFAGPDPNGLLRGPVRDDHEVRAVAGGAPEHLRAEIASRAPQRLDPVVVEIPFVLVGAGGRDLAVP